MSIVSLQLAVRDARGFAMDAIAKCKSGHLSLPLGAAEIGSALYGHVLSHNPDEPRWLNRRVQRFFRVTFAIYNNLVRPHASMG